MTIEEYANLVNKMMVAQKQFFRYRRPNDLEASKRIEKRVREVTARILGGREQRTLFGDKAR